MATRALDGIPSFPVLSMIGSQLLAHEVKVSFQFWSCISSLHKIYQLLHCGVISAQTVTAPSGSPMNHVIEHGVDKHPEGALQPIWGYYQGRDAQTPAERLQVPQYTLKNPDCFSYLLAIFAYRTYGWEDFRDQVTGFIRFRRTGNM